ncbi:MAG: hypothetical protein ABIJ57_02600 [Pseudomonadota bacterium]
METARTTGPITYSESIEAARKELAAAIKNGDNLLMPSDSLNNVPPMHKVTVERVKLSPNPDDRDVYLQQGKDDDEDGKKRFALTKDGLLKLSSCAGVQWDYDHSGRLDRMESPSYLSWRMVGAVQRLDGGWLPLQGSYDLDFDVISEQVEEQKRSNASRYWSKKDWWKKMDKAAQDAYIAKKVKEEVLMFKRHKVARCETGAMLRAIRGLLNVKGTYSAVELQKPFVIARLVFQPDYADPIIKAQAVALAFKAMQGVYGISQGPAQFQPRALPAQVVDMEQDGSGGYDMSEAERADPGSDQGSAEEVTPEQEYAAANKDGKVRIIEMLIKRKGYNIAKLARPVDEYSEEKLGPFFEHLLSLPDKPADDDIPL